MKKILTISVVGLFVAVGAATAGEGLKSSAYGGCGYRSAVKTATAVPTVTPKPTKTAAKTKTPPKTGG